MLSVLVHSIHFVRLPVVSPLTHIVVDERHPTISRDALHNAVMIVMHMGMRNIPMAQDMVSMVYA